MSVAFYDIEGIFLLKSNVFIETFVRTSWAKRRR